MVSVSVASLLSESAPCVTRLILVVVPLSGSSALEGGS